MATGLITVKQVRVVSVMGIRATPKQPLSRADKITRSISGYRMTSNNIAAIDFGTTSVSLAYITDGDKVISTLKLDAANNDTRVPNAILLEKRGKEFSMTSFGNHTRELYIRMRSADRDKYVYFERIKMLMKREQKVDRQTVVESFTGEKFYLVEVIAFILKYLRDTLIDHLSQTSKPLKTTDFDWVITVPAIWDAGGKRMMREAAYLAGLLSGTPGIMQLSAIGSRLPCPQEDNPDKLSLALEPEVAAIYSQKETAKEVVEAGTSLFLKPKGNYMVLDIGGGTVDITAQSEVEGGIEVISIPMGNDWGGTRVNEQFSHMLEKITEDPGFFHFLSSGDHMHRKAVLNKLLYYEFELQKYHFGDGKQHAKEMIIDIPREFIKYYGEEKMAEGAKRIPGVEFRDDTLYIQSQVVEEILFGPPVKGIVGCMLTILNDLDHHIDTMYLVGGFGGCKYLYETLGKEIHKVFRKTSCRIIVPKSPKLAVAVGAVMWRKNPDLIKARRVDATYGIAVSIPFNDDVHDPHYRFYNEEQQSYRCNNVFNVFVQKGERVQSDEVFTTALAPCYQSETKMNLDIWSTPLLGVQYIKDKDGKMNVSKIGELVIDIPNPDNLPREKRVVDVTMDFSGTEIQAKAKYQINEKEVKIVCDFLSAQTK